MQQGQMMKLLERPQAAIMGIINTTPDSFSDGGQFYASNAAIAYGKVRIFLMSVVSPQGLALCQ